MSRTFVRTSSFDLPDTGPITGFRRSPRNRPGGSQRGDGFLGATVALFVIGLLVTLFTRELERSLLNTQIEQSRIGVQIIGEALYSFRINTRAWPANMAALSTYAPSFGSGGRNGVGNPYSLVPPAPLNHPTRPITVRTDMRTVDHARRLVREFPGQASRAGTLVSVEIPIPGHEPARDSLLGIDGNLAMTGNLVLGDHDIDDAQQVGVAGQVAVGNRVDITGLLAVGDHVSVDGEDLEGDMIRFVDLAEALNCGVDERVTVSGSSAVCQPLPACPVCPTFDVDTECAAAGWTRP